ncbi:hypothetical protein Ccrd_017296 [Cynara cardunculus var. scolymus]|uniref:Uncharacterized protein n=1 Tax=Cynara cardunculus var. scolymus TaxID=59895 RepID=A0A103Y8D0_CYNCS|nr:hypothetical protein Ccrd_017296 [Cynara cardunculus var. scolymus]
MNANLYPKVGKSKHTPTERSREGIGEDDYELDKMWTSWIYGESELKGHLHSPSYEDQGHHLLGLSHHTTWLLLQLQQRNFQLHSGAWQCDGPPSKAGFLSWYRHGRRREHSLDFGCEFEIIHRDRGTRRRWLCRGGKNKKIQLGVIRPKLSERLKDYGGKMNNNDVRLMDVETSSFMPSSQPMVSKRILRPRILKPLPVEEAVQKRKSTHPTKNEKNLKLARVANEVEDERKYVTAMRLKSILHFSIEYIPSRLGFFVVDNFDDERMVLKLPVGELEITKDSV